ncbi:hypothetical protein JCM3774_000215 [Rhodotorula dairenensis]
MGAPSRSVGPPLVAAAADDDDDDQRQLQGAAVPSDGAPGKRSGSTAVHLCVILHGLWGSPAHVDYIKEALLRQAAELDQRPESRLAAFVSKSNSTSSGHLYDGFDVCAERVVDEIDAEVERIASDEGGTVDKFSIVGYSLGGVVARYALGILDSRTPSFFAAVAPVNLTTFASPAIGMPRYDGFWPSSFRYLGSRLLSRTGQQLYERDCFLSRGDFKVSATRNASGARTPISSQQSTASSSSPNEAPAGGGDGGEPLLKVMADPRFSFYRALCKFERVEIYANTTNDRSVPYCTAALEAHDPFALARLRAIEAAEAAGEPVTDVMDLSKGGLEVSFREGTPILASYAVTADTTLETAAAGAVIVANAASRKRLRLSLPPPLRPSTYPVSRPKALVVIGLLPVIWPVAISFLATRSLVHAKQSEWRIRSAQTKVGGGADGWLARVGIKLEEFVERAAAVDNPEYAAALDASRDEAAQGREGLGEVAESRENDDDEASPHRPVESEKPAGHAQPIVARSARRSSSLSSRTSTLTGDDHPTAPKGGATSRSASSSPRPPPPPVRIRPRDPRPRTDPVFSDSQLFQLEHLNAVPQLRKHLVHMPEVYWSHGAIIRRDRNFEQHEKGALVVDAWASEFRF